MDAKKKLSRKQRLSIVLKRFGFDSNYNFRKITQEEIKEKYKKYRGSSIENTYNGYDYLIVWIVNKGITGYIFKDGKALAYIYRFELDKEIVENKIKKFIVYIDKQIKKIDKEFNIK